MNELLAKILDSILQDQNKNAVINILFPIITYLNTNYINKIFKNKIIKGQNF